MGKEAGPSCDGVGGEGGVRRRPHFATWAEAAGLQLSYPLNHQQASMSFVATGTNLTKEKIAKPKPVKPSSSTPPLGKFLASSESHKPACIRPAENGPGSEYAV